MPTVRRTRNQSSRAHYDSERSTLQLSVFLCLALVPHADPCGRAGSVREFFSCRRFQLWLLVSLEAFRLIVVYGSDYICLRATN